MTTREEVIDGIGSEASRAVAMAERLSSGDWSTEVYASGWDVRQVYSHLAAGSRSTVPFLVQTASGGAPPGGWEDFDVDKLNARDVAAREGLAPQEIVAELEQGCAVCVEQVRELEDSFLTSPAPEEAGIANAKMVDILKMATVDHMREHLKDVASATGKN